MKKIILGIITLLMIGSIYAKELNNQLLTTGKWVDRNHQYPVTSIIEKNRKADDYTQRNRSISLSFSTNKTFRMDSLQQRYKGTWKIVGQQVILNFGKNTTKKLEKVVNPNSNAVDYVPHKKMIDLGIRVLQFNAENISLSDNSMNYERYSNFSAGLLKFWDFTAYANFTVFHLIMIFIGLIFIYLAIRYDYEPLLLIPIGFGILIGNIPFFQAVDFNLKLGIYEPGSVLNTLYQGVIGGWYPPLIFLGIGAMTDFSTLLSNPRLLFLGAAAQIGIFATFIGALYLGFAAPEAGAIGIIGGADGPTSIFLASKLANGLNELPNGETVRNLIGPIAIAAYSYMALVPVLQPPVIRLLTNKRQRLIRMKPPRKVSQLEKILFPIIGFLLTGTFVPGALPLLGMLFFGNLLKESTVTERLAETARKPLIDIVTILLGVTVGASTQADVFLQMSSVKIFLLGAVSFIIATAGGLIGAHIMNFFSTNKINPMIGAAGVSAVPDSARVVQTMGLKEDKNNHLLMHAMAPNVAGVIGSAVAAGVLLSYLL